MAAAIEEEGLAPKHSRVNVIMIGVGGAGSQIVDSVARYLKAYYKSEYGRDEIPKHMRIFAMDTDHNSLNSVTDAETYEIKVEAAHRVEAANPGVPLDIVRGCISPAGLGMRRYCAAALYNVKEGDLIGWFRKVAEELNHVNPVGRFLVIIVSSFGGGTGSGLMPLLANCAYDVLSNKQKYTTAIIGIGALPGNNELDLNYANAYGLLKELSLAQYFRKPISLGTQTGVREYFDPFNMFILLGTSTSQQADIKKDVGKAIAHFLVDLGYIVPERTKIGEGAATKLLDLTDLQTLASQARNKFVTINYYEVYLPVPLIEWLFSFEEEKPKLEESLANLRSKVSEVSDRVSRIESLVRRRLDSINDIKDKIDGVLKKEKDLPKIVRRNYLQIKDRVTDMASTLETIWNDIQLMKRRISNLNDMLEDAASSLRELEYYYMDKMEYLKSPPSGLVEWRIMLDDNDIEKLRELHRSGELKRLSLKRIMEKLGKEVMYRELVWERGFNRVGQEPYLLDYSPTVESPLVSDDDVREDLLRRGFLKVEGGKVEDPFIKGDYYATLISTREENLPRELVEEGWDQVVSQVARGGLLKIIRAEVRRYSFAVYFLAAGIRITPPIANMDPPLKDLIRISGEYETISKTKGLWDGLLVHHSLFIGKALSVIDQLGLTTKKEANPKEATEALLKFYRSYIPIDPQEVTRLLAYASSHSRMLGERLRDRIDMFLEKCQMIKVTDDTNPVILRKDVEDLSHDLRGLFDLVSEFEGRMNEYIDLTDRLMGCKPMMEKLVESQDLYIDPLIDLLDDVVGEFDTLVADFSEESDAEYTNAISSLREAAENLRKVNSSLREIGAEKLKKFPEWRTAIRKMSRELPELSNRISKLADRLNDSTNLILTLQKNFDDLSSMLSRMRASVEERGKERRL